VIMDAPIMHVTRGEKGVPQAPLRIELIWPGKVCLPSRQEDGSWQLLPANGVRIQYPFTFVGRTADGEIQHADSLIIEGERLKVLSTLRRTVPNRVKMVYMDLPRIVIDDKSKAFQGASDLTWSTYLSVVREHLRAVRPIVRRDGFIVVHCGSAEEPYVRLILGELYGKENHVGTVVWQRHYAPRNMRGMKEFTATHDPITIFAYEKDAIYGIALERIPIGYRNPDRDPRGPWKAEHKGARTRRENCNFETNFPPYRWELVDGNLPAGIWRVSPFSGVIWGKPTSTGKYPFVVRVTDKEGTSTEATLEIIVEEEGEMDLPDSIPWLLGDSPEGGGPLEIKSVELPKAVRGNEYYTVLDANGGEPFLGKKRPTSGRYWEFAYPKLITAALRDSIHFGKDGTSIPHPKKYKPEVERINQQTWWPGRSLKKKGRNASEGGVDRESDMENGYTEDATKHLKKLAEMGVINETVTTAKPDFLLEHLLMVLTQPGDTILELFGEAADLSSVAIKTGRRFIYLGGSTDLEKRLLNGCALPRLAAVIQGIDENLETVEGKIRFRKDAYIQYGGGGSFSHFSLGVPFSIIRPREEYPSLLHSGEEENGLIQALLSAEGFLPLAPDAPVDGESFDQKCAAVVIHPKEFLTQAIADEFCSNVPNRYKRLIIYYFRSSDDFSPDQASQRVSFKRVPMDLAMY